MLDEIIVGKMNEDGIGNPYAVTFAFKLGMRIDKEYSSKKHQRTQIKNIDNLCFATAHDTCCDSRIDVKGRVVKL